MSTFLGHVRIQSVYAAGRYVKSKGAEFIAKIHFKKLKIGRHRAIQMTIVGTIAIYSAADISLLTFSR